MQINITFYSIGALLYKTITQVTETTLPMHKISIGLTKSSSQLT